MRCGFVVTCTKRKASAFPMNQALEKAYNKPAKRSIRAIDISLQKDSSCWWNTVRHKKVKFKHVLQE